MQKAQLFNRFNHIGFSGCMLPTFMRSNTDICARSRVSIALVFSRLCDCFFPLNGNATVLCTTTASSTSQAGEHVHGLGVRERRGLMRACVWDTRWATCWKQLVSSSVSNL